MNQKTLLYLAFGIFAMRWILRDARGETDLVTRLRVAGAL
jgi:hypothetical protein